MIFGGAFQSDPLPLDVQEVSIVSSAEFEALFVGDTPPDPLTQPAALTPPDVSAAAPAVPPREDVAPDQSVPERQAVPDQPDPDPVVPPQPPETEVVDDTPQPAQPTQDFAALTPPQSARPQPRPVERVAPTPAPPPLPDATPDDITQPEQRADEGAETQTIEQDATAPEEATTEIVPDADENAEISSLAPTAAPRPPARPSFRPAQDPEPEPDVAESDPAQSTNDAVNAALTEALAGPSDPLPTGPPLTDGEKDALRVAISRCWNVGSLSTAALATTVVVGVELTETGTPVANSIRLVSSSGGDSTAARQAYEAARRAILRCGSSGFELPAEKYGQWRDIEMTFNPERMRIR